MEQQATEEGERRRLQYGPWTPAEMRAWENQEEAVRDHMERVRDRFRLEEETTLQNLETEQAAAREYRASLIEAESAVSMARQRQQREAAESQALDRTWAFFLEHLGV